ncbi:MAG: sulfite exporter TauE/SafE family protein [Methanomicrobiales archaeon]|nr:sulfite exporter TauE/SafE family protein [Methanomicrobiales archaeon]
MDTILILIATLLVTGVAAGFMAGLLGVGGAFLLVPVQFRLLHTLLGLDATLALRVAFATSLAVVLPTALSGAIAHHRHGVIHWAAAIRMGAAGIPGGVAGALIATHAGSSLLGPLFAALLVIAAARMLVPLSAGRPLTRICGTPLLLAIGGCTGILSGMFGIGGGIVLVPALILLCGCPTHRAVGTSTAFILLTSIGGLAVFLSSSPPAGVLPFFAAGYIDLLQWLVLAVTTIPMAQAGAWAAHRTDAGILRKIFAAMLVLGALDILSVA